MLIRFITLCFVCFSLTANATSEDLPSKIVLEFNADGELLDIAYAESWTNGNINQFYLDGTHTTKNFKDIILEKGQWEWELQTNRRNNKTGKINFEIREEFKSYGKTLIVNKKLSTGTTHRGSLFVNDFKSKKKGPQAGYGKLHVKVGRAGINTNCNYKITLTKDASYTFPACTPKRFGSKSGTIYFNTTSKVKSTKPACQDVATVTINKTGGKARTTVNIYKSSTVNGTGSLVSSYEFEKGKYNRSREFEITNADGYYIRAELRNRSAGNTFKYSVTIDQE